MTTSRKYLSWLVTLPGLSALGIKGGNTCPLTGSRAGSSPSSALGEPKFKDIFHLFLFLIFLKRLLFVNIDRRQVRLFLANFSGKASKYFTTLKLFSEFSKILEDQSDFTFISKVYRSVGIVNRFQF